MRSLAWILIAGLLWLAGAAVMDQIRFNHQVPPTMEAR